VHAATPEPWQIDSAASRLEFVAEQAGARFRGRFQVFTVDVRFAAERLAESRAVVVIDMTSATTFDDERDAVMRGDGWFETTRFPEARFEADRFVSTPDGFAADGRLTLRGEAHPVRFMFTVSADENGKRLEGRAVLNRLDLGLGLGEWADPAWIGIEVAVETVLVATRTESGAGTRP
jgi:polyisoprenoid-binding protein YceI